MKKKICLSVLAAMLMLSSVVLADTVSLSYSQENPDYVVISGAEQISADTKVTVSVFEKGKTYADLNGNFEDESDILAFAGITYSDENGNWDIEWKPDNNSEYDFYAAADGVLLNSEPYSCAVVSGMSAIYDAIKNGTQSDIKQAFAIPEVVKTFVQEENLRKQIENTDNIASSIYKIRQSVEGEDIILYIPLAARMAALDDSISVSALDAVVDEMGNLGITIDNLDVYSDYATADIKAEMAKKLDGSAGIGVEEFNSKFTEALILSGVWKCANWTDAQYFLDLMDNEYYESNKSKVAKAVTGVSYTMKELENAIQNAVKVSTGSSSGGGGGGSVSSVNVKVTQTPTQTPEPAPEVAEKIFNDVDSGHWAYSYINLLRWKNIVSGDENGDFHPDNNITRAETVKILCEAFGIEPLGGNAFEDVGSDKWYAGYVYAAYGKGLVSGTDEKSFSPDRNITRQELAVMIYRFAAANSVTFVKTAEGSFTDSALIAEYAKDAIEVLAGAEIITGMEDGRVCPENEATRAQTAVMVCKVIDAGKQVSE